MEGASVSRSAISDWFLDLDRGLIIKAGKPVAVRHKLFETLAFLARNPNRVISKDELVQAVWGGAAITDDALTQTISQARKCIGDENREIIRTVPKRGFLFASAIPAAMGLSETRNANTTGARHEPVVRPMVAVLPLYTAPACPRPVARLCDGVIADVIGNLASLRGADVIAKASSFEFRNSQSPAAKFAGQLGADYAVFCDVELRGSTYYIRTELVSVARSVLIWQDVFPFLTEKALALTGDLAVSIATVVNKELERNETRLACRIPTDELGAWSAYHRGLSHAFRFTPQENETAKRLFSLSTSVDPSFSRAYSALSFCHFQSAFHLRPEDRKKETVLARDAAQRAIELDDHDPLSLWSMGGALWLDAAEDDALRLLRLAIETSPSFSHGHFSLSFMQAQSGDPNDAIASSERSQLLSPLDPMLCAILAARTLAYLRLGRLNEAAETGLEAVKQKNAYVHVFSLAAVCLASAERWTEAERIGDVIKTRWPGYRLIHLTSSISGLGEDVLRFLREPAARLGL